MVRPSPPLEAILSQDADGLPAAALRARLGLPEGGAFNRVITAAGDAIVVIGKARATRYAWRRRLPGLPAALPLYRLTPAGLVESGQLHAIAERAFAVTGAGPGLDGCYPDLPWWLDELRPGGFLGRLIPHQHPHLHLPREIREWSATTVLRYLHAEGYDGVGDFIIGEAMATRALRAAPVAPFDPADRATHHPQQLEATLLYGAAGSSAGGEQPKFLATRRDPGGPQPVIVKASPPRTESVGRRVADLLRWEALALDVLREAGIPAAAATPVEGGDRVFLEVDRFDRAGAGRRGIVSLRALGAFHGGPGTDWTAEARYLLAQKVLPAATVNRIVLLDRFGALIGNTDRHHGNLSFFFEDGRLGALCPVYDMLPMGLAPIGMEARPPRLVLPQPDADAPKLWQQATALARTFWARAQATPGITPEMAAFAVGCLSTLQAR